MACRDMKKCKETRQEIVDETKNNNIFTRLLDLSSLDSIRQFAKDFKAEQTKLHILINNAGVMRCPRNLTKDGFEMQIGVNHMGHFLLTHLLLDVLKASAPSRILNVSSSAHYLGKINSEDLNSEKSYSEGDAYNQSKLANILFTRELAKRLEGTGVTANAVHPGFVNTELGRYWGPGRVLWPLLTPFMKSPESGAQTTLYAALDPDLDDVSGLYFSDCRPKEVSEAAKDDKTAKWLWTESEKWTGIAQDEAN
ncbi:retinol dehydrogenase 12-like [Drosophila willistoni]|uniref:retinol dehydrogenase 12-like n=1 Tax=Drosophila willistoni TaxID=7260 RepID=UPI000C26CCF8|nr:retinol dehydrogenase 12-like [Drosophila willistoni]